jgi:hypothetical protein
VLEYLAGRAADAAPIALPALAAHITGDTKALSRGTGLATLVLRALALQTGSPRPVTAGERRELWDRPGVLVDDLASRVLVLNLPAEGTGPGQWPGGAARYAVPGDLASADGPSDPGFLPAYIRMREPGRAPMGVRRTRSCLPAARLYRGPAFHGQDLDRTRVPGPQPGQDRRPGQLAGHKPEDHLRCPAAAAPPANHLGDFSGRSS